MQQGDRFMFVGRMRPNLIGMTGTIDFEHADHLVGTFAYDERQMRLDRDEIVPHGTRTLVGLSLSFCVRDLINGRIDLLDVNRIDCGGFGLPQVMIEHYVSTYWSHEPLKARRCVLMLSRSGMLHFPRLYGGQVREINVGHWRVS